MHRIYSKSNKTIKQDYHACCSLLFIAL